MQATGLRIRYPGPMAVTSVFREAHSHSAKRFQPTLKRQSLYDLTITTRDSAGATFSKDFQVDVIDQNDPPTLEVISALAVLENSEGPLIAFTASDEDDPDGFAADYSLLGDDADLFSLAETSLLCWSCLPRGH